MKTNRNHFQKKDKKDIPQKPDPIIIGDYTFPICGMKENRKSLELHGIYGTSFNIGGPYFLTAKHVIDTVGESPHPRIGFLEQMTPRCIEFYPFEIIEVFERSDLALIKCTEILNLPKKPKAFKWSGRELLIFEEVRSMGYPHGYDGFQKITISRGYTGTLVGQSDLIRADLNVPCYELSFQAPRGLSGAPLFDKWYNVHGVVIGNSDKEMHVFESENIYYDEGIKKVEKESKKEITFIGMAVNSKSIFKLESEVLGSSFHDYLIEARLHG